MDIAPGAPTFIERSRFKLKGSSKKKNVTTPLHLFSLPVELLKDAFALCSRADLKALCLTSTTCYSCAAPLLYEVFQPRHWTHVMLLRRKLEKRTAPAGVDGTSLANSIARQIQEIHLRLDDFEKGKEADLQGYLWNAEMVLQSMLFIVKRAKRLR